MKTIDSESFACAISTPMIEIVHTLLTVENQITTVENKRPKLIHLRSGLYWGGQRKLVNEFVLCEPLSHCLAILCILSANYSPYAKISFHHRDSWFTKVPAGEIFCFPRFSEQRDELAATGRTVSSFNVPGNKSTDGEYANSR